MSFWTGLFKPTCPVCGQKILKAPVEYDNRSICEACYGKALQAEAVEKAEIEARRKAEEEAYDAMMQRRTFGTDPRYGD